MHRALGVTLYQLLTGKLPYGEVLPYQVGRYYRDPVAGKAMKAEVEQREGRLRYNIWVLKDGDLKEIKIDAVSDATKAN